MLPATSPFVTRTIRYPRRSRSRVRTASLAISLSSPCVAPSTSTTSMRSRHRSSTKYVPTAACRKNLKPPSRRLRSSAQSCDSATINRDRRTFERLERQGCGPRMSFSAATWEREPAPHPNLLPISVGRRNRPHLCFRSILQCTEPSASRSEKRPPLPAPMRALPLRRERDLSLSPCLRGEGQGEGQKLVRGGSNEGLRAEITPRLARPRVHPHAPAPPVPPTYSSARRTRA